MFVSRFGVIRESSDKSEVALNQKLFLLVTGAPDMPSENSIVSKVRRWFVCTAYPWLLSDDFQRLLALAIGFARVLEAFARVFDHWH